MLMNVSVTADMTEEMAPIMHAKHLHEHLDTAKYIQWGK